MCHGYILYKAEIIFHKFSLHYHQNFSTFARLAVYRSLKLYAEESKLFTRAVC